jgi:hypothetical protein
MWRLPAARMPRVLKTFLCPYRRPRTQWGSRKGAPVGRGCCRAKASAAPCGNET